MIQYAPIIGDVVPGFTADKVVIPFTDNPAVGKDQISGYALQIKRYGSSEVYKSLTIEGEDNINAYFGTGEITINIDDEARWFNVREYYKFQLAYLDKQDPSNKTDLAYSSVAIGCCIATTDSDIVISINGLDSATTQVVPNHRKYIGSYENTANPSETLYSYHFWCKDVANGNMIQDDGEIIYNNTTAPQMEFTLYHDLEYGKAYVLYFSIKTINGYVTTKSYTITKSGTLPTTFDGNVVAVQEAAERDNGYILIYLTGQPVSGNFELLRSSDLLYWDKLTTFELAYNSDMSKYQWKDMSVEHGRTYYYAIQQYSLNTNKISEKVISNSVTAEFEDMFLTCGERQLKIAFDPKVSSFKNTILEQKTDTIGSQYPTFFRNNQVKYKELPLSGLISYWQDTEHLFISETELGLEDIDAMRFSTEGLKKTYKLPTKNLVDYNVAAERKFKLAVLDWLTDGKPKLFRSPTEGNYVVRLMNTSLSPNDTLGRMLHTFSCTAYEIMSSDYHTLQDNKIITLPKLTFQGVEQKWETITLTLPHLEENEVVSIEENGRNLRNIKWYCASPTQLWREDIGIELDDEKYLNITGTFETPADTVYNSLELDTDACAAGGVLSYERGHT